MTSETAVRMRTHCMWNAIRSALDFTRLYSETFSIAFIDVSGRTRMLWRESAAKPNGLAMAEKGAWTCLLSSPEAEYVNPVELRKQEARQASVNEHFRLDLLDASLAPGCHGYPMVVRGETVGFFGVSGVNPDNLAALAAIVQDAYVSAISTECTSHSATSFDSSGF